MWGRHRSEMGTVITNRAASVGQDIRKDLYSIFIIIFSITLASDQHIEIIKKCFF